MIGHGCFFFVGDTKDIDELPAAAIDFSDTEGLKKMMSPPL